MKINKLLTVFLVLLVSAVCFACTEPEPEYDRDPNEYIPSAEEALTDVPESRSDYTEITAYDLTQEIEYGDPDDVADKFMNKYFAITGYALPAEDGSMLALTGSGSGTDEAADTASDGDNEDIANDLECIATTDEQKEIISGMSEMQPVTVLCKIVNVSNYTGGYAYITGIE